MVAASRVGKIVLHRRQMLAGQGQGPEKSLDGDV
jgi:hypothetical protein